MNGGDLVGVNKRAPGSGSRGTREEETLPRSSLGLSGWWRTSPRLVRRKCAMSSPNVEHVPRLAAFQANHVAPRRRSLSYSVLNERFNPLCPPTGEQRQVRAGFSTPQVAEAISRVSPPRARRISPVTVRRD